MLQLLPSRNSLAAFWFRPETPFWFTREVSEEVSPGTYLQGGIWYLQGGIQLSPSPRRYLGISKEVISKDVSNLTIVSNTARQVARDNGYATGTRPSGSSNKSPEEAFT
jgi:hypothetical protein